MEEYHSDEEKEQVQVIEKKTDAKGKIKYILFHLLVENVKNIYQHILFTLKILLKTLLKIVKIDLDIWTN